MDSAIAIAALWARPRSISIVRGLPLLAGIACTSAYADSACADMDARTERFVQTLQKEVGKIAPGGQFHVKPVLAGSGRKTYDIGYEAGGSIRFHLTVAPRSTGDEELDISAFRTREGGALLSRASFGAGGGVSCGYLIHATGGRFRFEKIGGAFRASDLNGDGSDEIVVFEPQDWATNCGSQVAWQRVLRLDGRAGKLVDMSKDFARQYERMARDFGETRAAYLKSGNPQKECLQRFDEIVARAKAQTGSAALPNRPAPGDATATNVGPVPAQWIGKWRGPERTSYEFAGSTLRRVHLAGDEGRYRLVTTPCKWSPLGEELRDKGFGDCRFTLLQKTRSQADLVRDLDARLAKHKGEGDGRFVAAAAKSRGELAQMKPGDYQVILINDATEVSELVNDGSNLLSLDNYDTGNLSRYVREAKAK